MGVQCLDSGVYGFDVRKTALFAYPGSYKGHLRLREVFVRAAIASPDGRVCYHSDRDSSDCASPLNATQACVTVAREAVVFGMPVFVMQRVCAANVTATCASSVRDDSVRVHDMQCW